MKHKDPDMEISRYEWNDDQPIYRQLVGVLITWILSGRLSEGDAIPSIRKIASQFNVNPLTVSKACQDLLQRQILEKQRGVGLFVRKGCQQMLMQSKREIFLRDEWPGIVERMKLMDIDVAELLKKIEK
jgi:GntR family transcriptional regulator